MKPAISASLDGQQVLRIHQFLPFSSSGVTKATTLALTLSAIVSLFQLFFSRFDSRHLWRSCSLGHSAPAWGSDQWNSQCSFTHSFIHLMTHSFIHSLPPSFIPPLFLPHSFLPHSSLIHSLTGLLIPTLSSTHSFTHSPIHSPTPFSIHQLIHSLIGLTPHSYTTHSCSFTPSFSYSFIFSLTCPFTYIPVGTAKPLLPFCCVLCPLGV